MATSAEASLSGVQGPLARVVAGIRTLYGDRGDQSIARRMAAVALLIRVASAGLIFLTQIFLARWMGPFQFGVYLSVWAWMLLIGNLVPLGLSVSAQKFVPEYTHRKAFDRLRGFLSGSRWIVFAVATFVALCGAAAVRSLAPHIAPEKIIPLYVACAALPFFALSSMLEGIAQSYNWMNLAYVPSYIVGPFLLAVLVAIAHFAGWPTDATLAITAAAIATSAAALIQLRILDRRLGGVIEPGPKIYEIGTWLKTSVPIFAGRGFFAVLIAADLLVLQLFRPPQDIAVYYAAAKIIGVAGLVYFSVAASSAHRYAEYQVAGDNARLAEFVAGSVRLTFWSTFIVVAGVLALGKPFLSLFGRDFVAAYPVMFVLAIGILARASIGPAERLLNMLGQQRACALVYAGAVAVFLAVAVVVIPPFGIVGAAAAMSAALIVESCSLYFIAKRRLGLHIFVWRPNVNARDPGPPRDSQPGVDQPR